MQQEYSVLPAKGRVLDVGGGTGLSRPLLSAEWRYCCLDPDPLKLEGFRSKFPRDQCLEASGCEIPFSDSSFDLCLMNAVTHHLTDEEMRKSFAEVSRVLKPSGSFLIMDAIWNPSNLRGRFLWSCDRGSFPKTEEVLQSHLAQHFSIARKRLWKVHHEYALFWCSNIKSQ